MKLVYYDFEQFKTRFTSMSDKELVTEYANVYNRICDAKDLCDSGKLSFNELSAFLEDALMVQDYIGGYLAGLYIQEHAYIFASDNRFFPCGT